MCGVRMRRSDVGCSTEERLGRERWVKERRSRCDTLEGVLEKRETLLQGSGSARRRKSRDGRRREGKQWWVKRMVCNGRSWLTFLVMMLPERIGRRRRRRRGKRGSGGGRGRREGKRRRRRRRRRRSGRRRRWWKSEGERVKRGGVVLGRSRGGGGERNKSVTACQSLNRLRLLMGREAVQGKREEIAIWVWLRNSSDAVASMRW
jgi:hypothetical protein